MTNGLPVAGKVVSLTTSDTLRWEVPFHDKAGNVGFADGSFDQIGARVSGPASAGPGYSLRYSIPTNRLLLPLVP